MALSVCGPFLANVLYVLEKIECISTICWMQVSLCIHWVRLVNGVVHIFCIILIFATLSYQLMRGMFKISHYDHGYFDLHVFFFMYFGAISLRPLGSGMLHLPGELCLLCNNCLYLKHAFFGLRSILSDDNLAMPDFSWLVIFLMYLFASFYFQLFYVIMF